MPPSFPLGSCGVRIAWNLATVERAGDRAMSLPSVNQSSVPQEGQVASPAGRDGSMRSDV